MPRIFQDLGDAWREYRLIHTVSSRVAGLAVLVFCCWCFYLVFQRAEPTAVTLSLLTFIGFIGVYLTGGQRAAETFARRRDKSFPAAGGGCADDKSTDDAGGEGQ